MIAPPVAAAVLLSAAVAVAAASATRGGTTAVGELAFSVALRGDGYAGSAVCVASGGNAASARRLTDVGDYETAWSPDGRRFALAGGKRPTAPIRIANAGATGIRAVTTPRLATEDDSSPTWSPDGTRIAFVRQVFFGPRADYARAGVWIVDLDSGRERQLTRELGRVSWAPTGDLIAAEIGDVFASEVVLLAPDGRVARRIGFPARHRFDRGVAWSPDGGRLAVGGGLIVDRAGVVVGRYAPPSTDRAVTFSPSWSPDGSTIAFARAPAGYHARVNQPYLLNADLYTAAAAGGDAVAMTQTPQLDETEPEFRPGVAPRQAGTRQPCTVQGTRRRDVITGTTGDDLVDAGRGGDLVYGRGGDDLLVGGAGDDSLHGGTGRDDLRGGFGNDRLYSRDGARDRLFGGPGRDRASVDGRDLIESVEVRYPPKGRRAGRPAG